MHTLKLISTFTGLFRLGIIPIGLIFLINAAPVLAATRTWTGGHASSAHWNLRDNWGGVAVPVSGDMLVFPAGAARLVNTNNIAGLRLSAIEFNGAGGGYNLRGVGLVVSNGITALGIANNTISLDALTLETTQLFSVALGNGLTVNSDIALNGFNLAIAAIGDVTLRGSISGQGNVSKSGAGQLSLSGEEDNTFNGSLTVIGGTLAMNRKETISIVPLTFASRIAVPGNLILGNGSGTVVATSHFEHQVANTSTVTIGESATLSFNGHDDTIANVVLTGGTLTTEAGILTLGGDITSFPSSNVSVISGNVFLGGNSTFSVSGGNADIDLDILANIGGGIVGITKTGSGILRLGGTNTYLGTTTVGGGQLNVGNDFALGTANGVTIVQSNTQLFLEQPVDALGELLMLAGAGSGGTNAALRVAGGATIEVTMVLTAPATINVPSGNSLTIDAVISGTGPMTKIGGGTLRLEGGSANTFSGNLMAEDGLLYLSKLAGSAVQGDLIIGTATSTATARHTRSANLGGAVTVNANSLYDLDGSNESIDALTLIGGGNVQTGTGQLTLDGDLVYVVNHGLSPKPSLVEGRIHVGLGERHVMVGGENEDHVVRNDLVIRAHVAGSANIVKSGPGNLGLSASNSFTGTLTVEAGDLSFGDAHSLGTTGGQTILIGNSSIRIYTGLDEGDDIVVDEPLFMNTSRQAGGGFFNYGSNVWSGSIFLAQTTLVNVTTNSTLNISGVINGQGGLTKIGLGRLAYSGNTSNTYAGTTRVNEGTLRLNRTGGANYSIPGALIIGDGTGGPDADVVDLQGAEPQINNLADVIVNSSGLLRHNLFNPSEGIGSLAGNGRVHVVTPGWNLRTGENGNSTTFDGVISGSGWLGKTGPGTFTLNGSNTYSGGTVVSQGILVINGYQPQDDVTVMADGTLGGVGRVGNLTISGTLAPGNPLGLLQAASVDFAPGSDYVVELNGASSSTGYDSFYSTGVVDVAGAALDVSLGFAPFAGQEFVIGVFGSQAGTFVGLPEGSEVILNQIPLHLTYAGHYNHGIVLTVGELALRLATTRIEAGNGNGRIDPNECNNLFVTIENPTGSAVSIVSAHLDSLDPRIAVTQSEGLYGSVPALGFRTNRTAFQICSSPNYLCGLNARFHLVVDTAAHGRFAIPVTLPTGSPGSFLTFPGLGGPQPIPAAGGLSSQRPVTNDFLVGKVRVSLHATHPAVGDLRFRLISPMGKEVLLSANRGGNAANYGNNCSSRTTFDDDAPTKIAATGAPFAGTFAPEGNLSEFIGLRSEGIWTLLAEDTVAGDLGALQCWSLQLAPAECTDGGGTCESCLASVSGTLNAASRTMPHSLNASGYETGCGNADPCPGPNVFGVAPFRYDTHSFTNTGPDTCVTVVLNVPCAGTNSGLFCSAYVGDFNPDDICANFLGNAGFPIEGGSGACSFRVPAGQRFTVVVNEHNFYGPFQGCDNYSLELYGLPCPQDRPTLNIANDAGPDYVRLHWSTAYPGFQLQGTPNIGGVMLFAFTNVATAPSVIGGHYNVTNSTGTNNGFFRLRKP